MSWQLSWHLANYIYITMLHTHKTFGLIFRIAYTSKTITLHACLSEKYTNSRPPQKNQKRTFWFLRSRLFKILFAFVKFRKKIICVQSLSFTVWCAFVCHLGPHIGHTLGRLLRRRNYFKSWKQVCSFFIKSNCVIFVAFKVSSIAFLTQHNTDFKVAL